jgi:molybdate transport system regulatory protein
MEAAPFQGRIVVNTSTGEFLTNKRVCLLEAIDTLGSLSAAARSLPMSYRSAWEALECMQHIANRPLVSTIIGGPRGGGTTLTSYGRGLITLYRAVEKECQGVVSDFLPGA